MLIFYFIALASGDTNGTELIIWATPIADMVCCLTSIVLFAYYLKNHGQNKMEFEAKQEEQNENYLTY